MTATPAYFGCWKRVGHYFWLPGMKSAHGETVGPWGNAVDGGLTPTTTTRQGAAALTHCDGWTALAVHDYTVDSRGNSNSVFIFPEVLDFAGALEAAQATFPEVVARIGKIALAEYEGRAAP